MGGDPEHTTYLAARGPTVVRCLVLLGADPNEAERSAAEAFAELLGGPGPDDVRLYAALLGAEERRRARAGLPGLDPSTVAVALRSVAGLDVDTAGEVIRVPAARVRELLAAAPVDVHERAEELAGLWMPPVAAERVRAVVMGRRHRVWGWSGLAAVVAAASVTAAVALTRPDAPPRAGDELPPVTVAAQPNPADVVWWSDGRLHLPSAVVEVGEVRRLVAVGDGAAYVDAAGRLVAVRPDGRRTLLGRPAEHSALLSSPDLGLVAWTDATVPGRRRIMVYDQLRDEWLSGELVSADARLISFDGGWLAFGIGLSDWAWDPHGGPPRQTGNGFSSDPGSRTALVDVVAGTRLEQSGYQLRFVRVGSKEADRVPGFGGSLSSDGRLIITSAVSSGEHMLVDARSGAVRRPPFPSDWRVQAGTFVSSRRVAWLVDRAPAGPAVVVCGPHGCAAPVDAGPGPALIAQDTRR